MLDGVISASQASKRVMELRFNLPCPNHVVINRIKTPAGIDTAPKTLSQPVRIGTASRPGQPERHQRFIINDAGTAAARA